jgi:hypothetical protein
MAASSQQHRSTPVDGFDVVEEPKGTFTIMSDEGPVGETFQSFSSAYKFIQQMAPDAAPEVEHAPTH